MTGRTRHMHHIRLGSRWSCWSHAYVVVNLRTEEGWKYGYRRERCAEHNA